MAARQKNVFDRKMAARQKNSTVSLTAQVVGSAFVHQYYHMLLKSPEVVYRFYKGSSKLGRPDGFGRDELTSVSTTQAINDKIMSMDCLKAEISTVDAQESQNGGVIVLVTGYITGTGRDEVRREFTQSFFLATQEIGYFVLNDMFRYVGAEGEVPIAPSNKLDLKVDGALVNGIGKIHVAEEGCYSGEAAYVVEIERLKEEIELINNQRNDSLERTGEEIRRLKDEMELVRSQRDDTLYRLQEANEQKLILEQHLADSRCAEKDLQSKLATAKLLEEKFNQLKCERDNAIREVEELRNNGQHQVSSLQGPWNISEFTLLELQQATENFSDSRKIGEGGFGCVYRGLLRNTTVAIKMLNFQSLQDPSPFQQEVVVLSSIRHPNLVTLVGACSEASALVSEFLPHGSLEECLVCTNNTPLLTWQVRTRIIGEMCSALMFLHSYKPHLMVHGDLKPANILLDANFVSKLSDFGIARLRNQSNATTTTLCYTANPRGTLAYMDPDFLTTGVLTPQSDIYSFGIIILRLLTGKPPSGIATEVEAAMENNDLQSVIDKSAGEWPFVQAQQLLHLGLRCAQPSRRKRPNLVNDVWWVVEPLMKAASLSVATPLFGSVLDENGVPFYFICPIFQEVMRDPHIAADGFTYEAEAIRGWFDNGHDTSPMTNLTLAHRDLIPNNALRSAIQEYLQQQQQKLEF